MPRARENTPTEAALSHAGIHPGNGVLPVAGGAAERMVFVDIVEDEILDLHVSAADGDQAYLRVDNETGQAQAPDRGRKQRAVFDSAAHRAAAVTAQQRQRTHVTAE